MLSAVGDEPHMKLKQVNSILWFDYITYSRGIEKYPPKTLPAGRGMRASWWRFARIVRKEHTSLRFSVLAKSSPTSATWQYYRKWSLKRVAPSHNSIQTLGCAFQKYTLNTVK